MKIINIIASSLISFGIGFNQLTFAQEPPPPAPTPTVEPTVPSTPQEKVRIAVLDFDFSSVSNPAYSSLFPNGSKGVTDILINKLVNSGSYVVIERSQIEQVIQEQNLSASGLVDASTAAEIGRILGVQIIIIGAVTQFDVQQQKSGGGGLGIGVGVNDTDANVKLNARAVNTTTAEIIAVAEGNGNASQSDSQVSVLGIGGGSATDNTQKLLTLATEQAIDQVVTQLNSNSSKLASASKALPSVNALVADVTGNVVVLNKGQSDGYRNGMQVSIERVSKEIKDPATGKVIRQLTQQIGVVQIYEIDATSSLAKIVSGSKFKVGDLAKPTQ